MSSSNQAITSQGIIQQNLDSEHIAFKRIQTKIKQEINQLTLSIRVQCKKKTAKMAVFNYVLISLIVTLNTTSLPAKFGT